MNDKTTLSTETLEDGLVIVRINGDLDSLGTHMVEKAFNQAVSERDTRALVDLHRVGFISSAGMAMLLVKGKSLRQTGGNMYLAGASKRVLEVLSMAGFNELFDMFPTVDEALAALQAT